MVRPSAWRSCCVIWVSAGFAWGGYVEKPAHRQGGCATIHSKSCSQSPGVVARPCRVCLAGRVGLSFVSGLSIACQAVRQVSFISSFGRACVASQSVATCLVMSELCRADQDRPGVWRGGVAHWQASDDDRETIMRVLLAILLPCTAFFRLRRTGAGVFSLLLQLSVVGWLPAAFWAVYALGRASASHGHARHHGHHATPHPPVARPTPPAPPSMPSPAGRGAVSAKMPRRR